MYECFVHFPRMSVSPAWMYVYQLSAWCPHRQKRASDLLGWLLSYQVGAGNWTCTRILYKTGKCSKPPSQLCPQPHQNHACMCDIFGCQRTTVWSQFSPSTFLWVLGLNLRSPGPRFYFTLDSITLAQDRVVYFLWGSFIVICLFLMCLCVSLYVDAYIRCVHVHESVDTLRDQRCQIPWTWSYRWFWAPLHEC